MKGWNLIKLDYGISLWPNYPPYRISFSFNDQTVDLKFVSLLELEHYINGLTKLREYLKCNVATKKCS